MKRLNHKRVSLCVLLLLVAGVRYLPGAGEWYATQAYPLISRALSWGSSFFPFSVDECIALLGIFLLFKTLLMGLRRKWRWHRTLGRATLVCLTYLVWFYLGWGCNYYRDNFFQRMQVSPAEADQEEFLRFANAYTDSLNNYYLCVYCQQEPEYESNLNKETIISEIKALYQQVPPQAGICQPLDYQQPKTMLLNRLYSASGVLGFMGPWAGESLLNEQLLPVQYPFTCAHEISHLLGVAVEAEANYWAYAICTKSESPFVRYSAYFGLLYHVMVNASRILDENEYRKLVTRIRPEIFDQQKEVSHFWQEQRISWLDKTQDFLLDMQLKGNNIPSGKANYSQVVQMIISAPPHEIL